MTGLVLRAAGPRLRVRTALGDVDALLPGRFRWEGERAVAGDRVRLERRGDAWVVVEVEPRRSTLRRRLAGLRRGSRVLVANVDFVGVVCAAARPDPSPALVDRLLVLVESSELPPLLVVNKIDLVDPPAARSFFGLYERIGYEVLYTSVVTGEGIAALRQRMCAGISTLIGPSGAGKSSLLNAVEPGLQRRVGEVSAKGGWGRHTTTAAELVPLSCGGYVADTPGLREIHLWEIDPAALDACFPEFRPYLGACRFGRSCTHRHEPDCAVRAALARGEIAPSRYESYRILRAEAERAMQERYR
jgi:ribosome biogenesis GTPase